MLRRLYNPANARRLDCSPYATCFCSCLRLPICFLFQKHLAYIHVMDGLGFGFHEKGEAMTLAEFKKVLPDDVALFGNVG